MATQIFDRSHLKVNKETQDEIFRRFHAYDQMLDALVDAREILNDLWDEDLEFRGGKYAALSSKIRGAIKEAVNGNH